MSPLSRIRPLASDLSAEQGVQAAAVAVVAAISVATLYFARDVLIPFTLAVLLSFILAPLIKAMRKLRVPRAAAVAVAVSLAVGLCVAIGVVISSQLASLAEDLPRYETNLKEKIRSFRSAQGGDSAIERAAAAIKELGNELSAKKAEPGAEPAPAPIHTGPSASTAPAGPTRVIVEDEAGPLKPIEEVLAPLVKPLATAGLVLLFTIFILLQREDFRDRLIRLFGIGDLNRTTVAMNEAAGKLSRYFLITAALNASFGIFIGIALSIIGVPSPVLWGLVAGVMRFVPYIGSIIAAVFPIALAAAVDPGWSMVAWTAAVFIIGEPLMGHIVEPLVYGRHVGLSPLAVVTSATFWTWLWGPIGLILATPITLCLVVLGQRVEKLEFLSVLLGSEPALSPEQRFYQRLLAGDGAEVTEQAVQTLTEKSLVGYYDTVALPGLRLAQHDERSGRLDAERIEEVGETVEELIETLDLAPFAPEPGAAGRGDGVEVTSPNTEEGAGLARLEAAIARDAANVYEPPPVADVWKAEDAIVVVSGRGEFDEASAHMLAQMLRKSGFGAVVRGDGGLSGIALAFDNRDNSRVLRVIISTVGGVNAAQARFLVRRIERALPNTPIMLGAWSLAETDPDVPWLRKNSAARSVVTSFGSLLTDLWKAAASLATAQESEEKAQREAEGIRATLARKTSGAR